MKLYKFSCLDVWHSTILYGRNKKDILSVFEHYHNKIEERGIMLNELIVPKWMKEKPKEEEIIKVDKGVISFYSAGTYNESIEVKLEDIKILDITKDFAIELNIKHVKELDEIIKDLPDKKRGELYKFMIKEGHSSITTYIPRDIMQGFVKLDLSKIQ